MRRRSRTHRISICDLATSHLVLRDAPVLLQHLQQLLVLLVELGDLLPVELQQLPGGTQVGQPLLDWGKRGVWLSTGGGCVGSVGLKRKT